MVCEGEYKESERSATQPSPVIIVLGAGRLEARRTSLLAPQLLHMVAMCCGAPLRAGVGLQVKKVSRQFEVAILTTETQLGHLNRPSIMYGLDSLNGSIVDVYDVRCR
jgi:hypothetical protein